MGPRFYCATGGDIVGRYAGEAGLESPNKVMNTSYSGTAWGVAGDHTTRAHIVGTVFYTSSSFCFLGLPLLVAQPMSGMEFWNSRCSWHRWQVPRLVGPLAGSMAHEWGGQVALGVTVDPLKL